MPAGLARKPRAAAALLSAAVLLVLVYASASSAGSPASARAAAALVTGTVGEVGGVSVDGDDRRTANGGVSARGVSAASGSTSAKASRDGGRGIATANAVARSVRMLDGLVTAYGVRWTASADGAGGSRSSGRVDGLVVDGRSIGTVSGPASYDLDGYGTLSVLGGDAGLRVQLRKAYKGHPAGTVIAVAHATASASDAVDDGPAADDDGRDLAPQGEDAHKPAEKKSKPRAAKRKAKPLPKAKRRAAPKVDAKLTGQRYAFPVVGDAGFGDDFGGPRQIGPHQGNDIFAPHGTPVVAVADGTVDRVGTLRISGNRLWLATPGGDEFFYAHLSAFAPAARNGNAVRAGTVLGFVGSTGDAERTPPHLHFEIHPAGGDAVDPFPFLNAWRAREDVPPAAWLLAAGARAAQRPGLLVEVEDYIAGG